MDDDLSDHETSSTLMSAPVSGSRRELCMLTPADSALSREEWQRINRLRTLHI